MVYVDPTIPLPAEPSYPFSLSLPSGWLNSLGTWHFLPALTDLLILHFDSVFFFFLDMVNGKRILTVDAEISLSLFSLSHTHTMHPTLCTQ